LTLLIVVLIGRAVIRPESNGTSGSSSPAKPAVGGGVQNHRHAVVNLVPQLVF